MNEENKREIREDKSTHHKPLRVLLYMFVRGDGNRHSLLVAVVVVGLDVLGSLQTVGLLRRNGQDGQNQLFLAGTDQVHHLLMGGTFHADAIPGTRGGGMKRDKEGDQVLFPFGYTVNIAGVLFFTNLGPIIIIRRRNKKIKKNSVNLTSPTRRPPGYQFMTILVCN